MNIEQLLRVLTGAFLVQGLLAIITWSSTSGSGPSEPRDLVAVDAAELEKITIYDSVQRTEEAVEPLVLEKSGEGWVVPSQFSIAATDAKMERLLEQIDKLESRRPIAQNAYRHADLDVAEDQHTRKLVLTPADGEDITVYLGSAQGSAAHVRLDGDDNVYLVRGITGYGISTAANQYFDRNVLKVDANTVDGVAVTRADGTSFAFTRTDVGWTVDVAPPQGRSLDNGKAQEFISKMLNVSIREPLGTDVTPAMGFGTDQATVVSWTSTEDGATVAGRFEIGAEVDPDSGRYFLRIDGQPLIYEVLGSAVENAKDKPLTNLFVLQ